jgi:hypothetical protein
VLRGERLRCRRWTGAPVWRLAEADWKSDGAIFTPAAVTPVIRSDRFHFGRDVEPKGVVIHQNILANIVPVEGEVMSISTPGRFRRPVPEPVAVEPYVRPGVAMFIPRCWPARSSSNAASRQ